VTVIYTLRKREDRMNERALEDAFSSSRLPFPLSSMRCSSVSFSFFPSFLFFLNSRRQSGAGLIGFVFGSHARCVRVFFRMHDALLTAKAQLLVNANSAHYGRTFQLRVERSALLPQR